MRELNNRADNTATNALNKEIDRKGIKLWENTCVRAHKFNMKMAARSDAIAELLTAAWKPSRDEELNGPPLCEPDEVNQPELDEDWDFLQDLKAPPDPLAAEEEAALWSFDLE